MSKPLNNDSSLETLNLRLMTFNIRGARGEDDDGVNAWANRADLNLRTIQGHAPDIIGFQECQSGNLAAYQTGLTGYAHTPGPPTSNAHPDRHEYLAIFWRADRFEKLDSGGFYLSRTPEMWSGDWATACVRAAHWIKFRSLETGLTFLHCNTHLDHVSKLARREGSKVILTRLTVLNGEDLPLFITGDFNTNAWNPGSEEDSPRADECHQLYREAGFSDTFLVAGHQDSEDAYTFHAFKGDAYSPAEHHLSLRIDWVLTRNGKHRVETQACAIIRDQALPLYPSDHYPVVADLVMS